MGKSSSKPSRKRQDLNSNAAANKTKKTKTVMAAEDGVDSPDQQRRQLISLSEVVSDCTQRWFQDTLKEAKAGDVNMQVLVGQMYNCGYGVPKDADKGNIWIRRASRIRSAVWKVSNKRPGYNASDSDSDEVAGGS